MQSNKLTAAFAAAILALTYAPSLHSSDELVELTGVVTNSVSGEPVARAHITLSGGVTDGGNRQKYGTMTGADGRFSIGKLASGSYIVQVDRVGFTMLYSTSGARGNQLRIEPGEQQREVTLKLTPWGSISGRVLDADGEPLVDATVYAEQGRGIHQADTDEKGRFRVGMLTPGNYRLKVVKEDQSLPPEIRTDGTTEIHLATTYYPASRDKEAAAWIEVQPGSEVPGIEVRMIGVPIVGILGKVLGIPAGSKNVMVSTGGDRNELVRADGSFALWRLDPGHYSVSASGQTPNGRDFQTDWADVDIAGSNIEHVELRTVPPAPLTGHLEFEDETAKQMLHPLTASKSGPETPPQLVLEELRGNSGDNVSKIGADDSFRLEDVTPGKYRVTLIGVDGAYVQSIRFGQADIDGAALDLSHGVSVPSELVLSLSSAMGSVSGVVRDQVGSPAPGVKVGLVNGENERSDMERILVTEANARGVYSFGALPPGKYRLAVAYPSDPNQLTDEKSAAAVEIQAGQTASKDLTLPN